MDPLLFCILVYVVSIVLVSGADTNSYVKCSGHVSNFFIHSRLHQLICMHACEDIYLVISRDNIVVVLVLSNFQLDIKMIQFRKLNIKYYSIYFLCCGTCFKKSVSFEF